MIECNERKVIRNRNIVREVDRHSTRELRWSIYVGSLFAGLMFIYSWQQHRMVDYGYRIESLKREQAQLEEARRKLDLDQATLESPGRISKMAEKLGLVTPSSAQVIFESAEEGALFKAQPVLALQAGSASQAMTVSNSGR